MASKFDLVLKKCQDKDSGEYLAVVFSDSLDARISKSGRMEVFLDGCRVSHEMGKGMMRFDSMIFGSIQYFCENQNRIMESCEKALKESFAKRGQDMAGHENSIANGVFKHAKFIQCEFRSKIKPINSEEFEELKRLAPNLKLKNGDPDNLETYFGMVFKCDWDDEHQVKVEFENGICKGAFLE